MAGNIYAELLDYQKSLKPWQQDVLRRHASTNTLSSSDIDAVADIAFEASLKSELSLDERDGEETTFTNPEVVPLSEKHVPSSSDLAPPVNITKVKHIQGVNRLRLGTEMTLAPTGLNIVFGLNGVGKSGYTRILKSCCHAKAKDPIKANVYEAEKPEPSAKIWYQLGDAEVEHEWNPSKDSDNNDLSRVAVYDSQTAQVHVGKQPAELSFTPAGLDIIANMIATYDAVTTNIKSRIAVLNAIDPPTIITDAVTANVRKVIDKLGQPEAVGFARVVATMTDDERADLGKLPGDIADLKTNSKTARASQARTQSTSYRNQGKRFTAIAEKVSSEQVNALKLALVRLIEIEDEKKTQVPHDFVNEPVPNVLSPHWKSMWSAVQNFAKDAGRPDTEFPDTETKLCLLCHQELTPEAHARLSLFKDAMSADLDAESVRLSQSATAIIAGIRSALNADNINEDMLTLMEEDHGDAINSLRGYMELAKTLAGISVTDLPEKPESINDLTAPFIDAPEGNEGVTVSPVIADQLLDSVALFETIACEFDTTVKAVEDELEDGSVLSTKMDLLKELEERSRLHTSIESIRDHHNKLIHINALRTVIGEATTNALSAKSGKLVSDYIARIGNDFSKNLKKMEDVAVLAPIEETRLRVKLLPSVKKGVQNISFVVDGATDKKETANGVLSEGELKAVTLAAFLADVNTTNDGSAIIFDDPMNSLDHDFQLKVATRLVEEAHHRQVIIFTHSTSFVDSLLNDGLTLDIRRQIKEDNPNPVKIDTNFIELRQHPELGTGMQVEGTGTPKHGFKNILNFLNDVVVRDARLHYKGETADQVAYFEDCIRFANNMRQAWEYAVEGTMLDGIVARNKASVQTGQLSSLLKITAKDVVMVEEGMHLDSFYVHSTGLGNEKSPTSPTAMQQRIDDARAWLKEFNGRKAN